MDRNAFGRLCYLLEHLGGLAPSRDVLISEQVAIFLLILAHHSKNRVVKFAFLRSGQTISKHFHLVLRAVLRLHPVLTVAPNPIDESCTDGHWKWFKGCLGALDGTYVPVQVRLREKPRYRNWRGEVSVNVLGVCDLHMKFNFVLTGWEGSAADSHVLRDAITRNNGLKVPTGNFLTYSPDGAASIQIVYATFGGVQSLILSFIILPNIGNYHLCDCGYTNSPGFLVPYRGVRYHLDEWSHGRDAPQNYKELFNLRHARARNAVERSFGILKKSWAILRTPAFYNIKTQNKLIMACCLVHNFIRESMAVDPMEHLVDKHDLQCTSPEVIPEDYIDQVEPAEAWTTWRDMFAWSMYDEYREVV
ncbi:hypothetical protein PHJA_001625900 [Phtheirospermum japonicum]|uniref:DDE Tnp4 domain-containing protein n=1 Tax=Phtheirospermum japonicum TaxID=374723 RepID=A0A830CI43_9LAMI|nr:hypothetical protein PHJA_001625900 [Phtheirospermum japonicum]